MKRVESLDYARGAMALSILFYHYLYLGGWKSIPLLSKLSLYGVTIFFILSGLSLSIAYKNYDFKSFKVLGYFFWKRIIRIDPLFWLILSLYLLYYNLSNASYPSTSTIISNYTLSFGFLTPMKYYLMGGWSIGVELVLYVMFPIIFILLQKKSSQIIFYLFLLFLFIYTTFYFLDKTPSIGAQWKTYIDPINHLFYFSIGIIISKTTSDLKNITYGFLAAVAAFLFIYYQLEPQVNMVFGRNKIILSVLVIVFVYSIYHFNFTLPKFIHYVLKTLGEISYGVYLFHPIILKFILIFLSASLLEDYKSFIYIISGFMTITVSYVVYKYYEKPIMKKLKISAFEKRP